jgi:transposase-like protein
VVDIIRPKGRSAIGEPERERALVGKEGGTRKRWAFLNERGQEAQHFLLASASCTMTSFEIASLTEDQAYDRFKAIRFAENEGKPFCPACGCCNVYDISTRRTFKCAACRVQFSVTSGTTFASRKMSFRKILYAVAVYVNAVSGIAALRLRREVGCAYKTAFVMGHKIRTALANSRENRKLRGEIEVDGVAFNPHQRSYRIKKCNKSRPPVPSERFQFVVAARERCGETRLTVVTKHEGQGSKFVRDIVERGSTLISDKGNWTGFNAVGPTQTVNHSIGFKIDGVDTNQIESLFARVRRLARGVHYRVYGKNLDLYAEEAAWRDDYRRLDNAEQLRHVLHAITHQPISRRWKGYWQRWEQSGAERRNRKPRFSGDPVPVSVLLPKAA